MRKKIAITLLINDYYQNDETCIFLRNWTYIEIYHLNGAVEFTMDHF